MELVSFFQRSLPEELFTSNRSITSTMPSFSQENDKSEVCNSWSVNRAMFHNYSFDALFGGRGVYELINGASLYV